MLWAIKHNHKILPGPNGRTKRFYNNSDFPLNTYKPGLNLDLFLNHSTKERTGIKIEALNSQLGTTFDDNSNKIRLNYFKLPVYGVLYTNDRRNDFRPKFTVEPYLQVLYGASVNNLTADNYKSLDLGGKAAAGFNWKVSQNVWLNSELYFGRSFVNINKTNNLNIKNQSIGLNMCLSFPLK